MIPWLLTILVACGNLERMKPAKSMTIRLSRDQADALDMVANVDDQPVVEVIRAAIAEHIEKRRQDRKFQDGLKQRIDRAKQMLVK
jgi:predicted transcriptional regulator